MAKSRRKKNYKLRRRVMRTVAALTMIMAIVVAAIPVENLDRVWADYADDAADINYAGDVSDNTGTKYTDLYNASTYEDSYTTGNQVAELQIQRIENGTITNLFKVKKPNESASSAVITQNSLTDTYTTLAIQDQEYYEYVQFDYEFCQELKDTFSGTNPLSFILEYPENTESIQGGTSTNTDGTFTFNSINLITLGTPTGRMTGSSTGTVADSSGYAKGYKNYNLGSISAMTVFEQYGSGFLTDQNRLVETYNKKISDYRTELNNLRTAITNNTAGQNEVNRWNEIISEINALATERNNAKTLTKTYSDFVGDTTDLTDLEQYIICQFFGSNSARNNLREYSLVRVTNATNNAVYIPKLIAGRNPIGDQQIDPDDYLVSGRAVIDGIAHEAFMDSKIRELSIPSNIKFIGADAFKNSNLTTVTINDANCTIIGDRAFANCTNLTNVSFTANDASKLRTIAHEAFAGDSSLGEVTIPNTVEEIGEGCFSSTGIRTLTFAAGGNKNTHMNIRKYAFYDCTGLSSVSFPEVTDGRMFRIEKCAFALGSGSNGGNLNTFTFPASNTKINYGADSEADKYDYILANRTTLKEVVWPGLLDNEIPDNTLWGCANLELTKFPDGANRASYDPDELFMGVYNENFYVEGPMLGASGNTSRAVPRETTWHAKAGKITGTDGSISYNLVSVPYKFTDASGDHFEIGVKENENDPDPKYIATIDVTNEANKEATLANYFSYGTISPNDRLPINIPAMVGQYTIVAIGENCFNDDIKNKIYELTIEDGSVRRIEAEAFKGASELQLVKIGNDVSFIGRDAFAECGKLQDVIFSQTTTTFLYDGATPEAWAAELVIEDNAFKTGSEYLTFHGAINSNYAPFKLAMSENNVNMTSSRSQVCYKTDAPLHLTVIRDNGTGKATLIDYPHYEEIDLMNKELLDKQKDKYQINDYSITDKFEAVNEVRDNSDYDDMDTMDPEEDAVVLQTLTMQLPDGIESIDSKAYFSNTANSNDFVYFNRIYKKNETAKKYEYDTQTRELNVNRIGDENVRNLYATYDGPDSAEEKTLPGLFSGYFNESIVAAQARDLTHDPDDPNATEEKGLIWQTYNTHDYTENYDRGNDYLTTISMPTVEEIPDYGFDSNENLKVLEIDEALNEVGAQPFRDCKSLYQINTGNSRKYAYENMLFYENQGDAANISYKIIQCLEGRGRRDVDDGNYGSTVIDSATNPSLAKVSSIADYAFANCDRILEVNLKDAVDLKMIPVGAFSDCVKLAEVTLPASVNRIDEYAFEGVSEGSNFKIEVPNPNCVISDKAFDFDRTEHVYISGVQYIDEATKEESTAYNSYLQLDKIYGDQIDFVPLGSTYTVRFYDEDYNQLGESFEIASGADVPNPPTDAARAAAKTGRRFDKWVCLLDNGTVLSGDDAYKNVTENRRVIAQYVDDPNSVVPDGRDYTLTVENGKALVNGAIISTFPATLKGGTTVTVIANDETNFKVWTITPGTYTSLLTSATIFTTTFTMPNANVTVTANTAIGGSTDTPNPDGTYTVTVNNGTGGGNYRPGVTVTITANTPPSGQTFTNWTTGTNGVSFANANTASTTFVMPASNVTVTANYSGGSSGGNTGDNNTTKHKVTVNYGSGSGEYAAGETVNISAYAPESSNRVFSRWTTSNSGLGFANANSATTSFVMPAADVVVTANYKVRTSDDDDDDDDSPSRRPGTSTSTTTVNNRPSSSTSTTSTTGTVNNPSGSSSGTASSNNNDGNRIYITKNGISNTDVASLAVSGSTDNFIVRITESAEATAAVEQALTNTYGSLNGLAYLPMDISLYDATGQNKITDTYGLNITVTMPIPDVLIQYGGNARVAAADNGVLQQITPRFTTIDGIACISFVPPHFSPYVIYVDTNNLIAGQMLDATPATGDPIHPKWFAAIGMACVSILLFVTSDGRKRKKFRAA